jgi:hypothetical protein
MILLSEPEVLVAEVWVTTARAFPGNLTVSIYLRLFSGVSEKVKRAGTLYEVSQI